MKNPEEKAVKKSISLPDLLAREAQLRQHQLRLSSFSDYIQNLIRRDTEILHGQHLAEAYILG